MLDAHHSYDPCCSPVPVSIPLQNRGGRVPTRGHFCRLRAPGARHAGTGRQVPMVTGRGGSRRQSRRTNIARALHALDRCGLAGARRRTAARTARGRGAGNAVEPGLPMAEVTFVSSTSGTATGSTPDASLSTTSPHVTENCDALPSACVLAWCDGAGPVRWWRCADSAALADCSARCIHRAARGSRRRSGAGSTSCGRALLKAAACRRARIGKARVSTR